MKKTIKAWGVLYNGKPLCVMQYYVFKTREHARQSGTFRPIVRVTLTYELPKQSKTKKTER